MLADDKAKDAAGAFFREWLEIDQIASLPKDAMSYPDYKADLQGALVDETEAFAQSVLFDSGGKLETLLTADYTFSNQLLGKVYGNSATGTMLAKTTLDATQPLGLLGEPAFLTGQARQGHLHQADVRRLAAAAAQRAGTQAGQPGWHHAPALHRARPEPVRHRLPHADGSYRLRLRAL